MVKDQTIELNLGAKIRNIGRRETPGYVFYLEHWLGEGLKGFMCRRSAPKNVPPAPTYQI